MTTSTLTRTRKTHTTTQASTTTPTAADPLRLLVGLQVETWHDGNQHSGTIQRVTEQAITMTDSELGGTITTGPDKVQIDDLTELVQRLVESGVQPKPRGLERYVGLECLAWMPDYAIKGVIVEAGQHGAAVRLDPDDRPSDEREIVALTWSEIQVYADKLLAKGIVPEAAPAPVQAPPAAIGGKLGDTINAVRRMAEVVGLVDDLDGKGSEYKEAAEALYASEAALRRYLGELAAEEPATA